MHFFDVLFCLYMGGVTWCLEILVTYAVWVFYSEYHTEHFFIKVWMVLSKATLQKIFIDSTEIWRTFACKVSFYRYISYETKFNFFRTFDRYRDDRIDIDNNIFMYQDTFNLLQEKCLQTEISQIKWAISVKKGKCFVFCCKREVSV